MKRPQLIKKCEALIKSFDPTITTVDAHALEFLGEQTSTDNIFLKQVFYGCVRYKQMLKIFLSNFYHDNSGTTNRNDYTMYTIMSYLAIFRLKELTFPTFQQFVMIQDPSTMHTFLSYLFSEEKLKGPIRAEWIRILDLDYVETTIIHDLLSFRADIDDLLQRLHHAAFGLAAAKEELEKNGGIQKVARKESTVPVAPKISRPKPRRVPEPERIDVGVKIVPIPDFSKTTLADIEKQDVERKKRIKEDTLKKHADAALPKFQEIRSNLEDVKKQVTAEREAEMQFSFRAKPPPTYPESGAHVKLNVSSILREDYLYKKKQEQEAQLIKNYESDLRDSTDFYRWKTEMEKKDQELKLLAVEERRQEMMQIQQQALEASLRAKEENRQTAEEIKKISKEAEEQLRIEKQKAAEANKVVAEEIKKTREIAPRMAEEKIKEENHKKRVELNKKLAEDRERKEKQDAIEQAQREDLIRQIRALDRVHREYVHVFDPTESSNIGLLEEMSLVELKERLKAQKARDEKALDEKKRKILSEKQAREDYVTSKIHNIVKIRNAASESNRKSRERRKQQASEAAARGRARRDEATLQLAHQLASKRAEATAESERLRAEEDELTKKRSFLGAAKHTMEETHFDQLLRGAQRLAADRQRTAKEAAAVYEATKRVDAAQRHRGQRTAAAEAQELDASRALSWERAEAERRAKLRTDRSERTAWARDGREHEREVSERLRALNPYGTKVAEESVARGIQRRLLSAEKQKRETLVRAGASAVSSSLESTL